MLKCEICVTLKERMQSLKEICLSFRVISKLDIKEALQIEHKRVTKQMIDKTYTNFKNDILSIADQKGYKIVNTGYGVNEGILLRLK